MTTVDFITDLFCRIDDEMRAFPKHPQAQLWPSEVVTPHHLSVCPKPWFQSVSADFLQRQINQLIPPSDE